MQIGLFLKEIYSAAVHHNYQGKYIFSPALVLISKWAIEVLVFILGCIWLSFSVLGCVWVYWVYLGVYI